MLGRLTLPGQPLRARLAQFEREVRVRGRCHAGTNAGGTVPRHRFRCTFVIDYFSYATTGSTFTRSRRWIPAGGSRVLHGHLFRECRFGVLFSCMCVLVSFNYASSRGVCSMALGGIPGGVAGVVSSELTNGYRCDSGVGCNFRDMVFAVRAWSNVRSDCAEDGISKWCG